MMDLPDDIWYMISTELRHQRDLNTLFNCACSGKRLAPIALTNLYRIRNLAPAFNGSSDEKIRAHDKLDDMSYVSRLVHEKWVSRNEKSQKERYMNKRARLWRTIILSSLGETLYPYSQHIRTLDLQHLSHLLSNPMFTQSGTCQDFFRGKIAQFKVEKDLLDAREIINRIGEAITKQTPLLEKLTGYVRREALSRWIPRLPRLTYLRSGGAAIEGNGNLIRLHCPSFKGLSISSWDGDTISDRALATFLIELRPQSLQSFEAHNDQDTEESFQALCCHGELLTELKFDILPPDAIPRISLLKGCTKLVSLSLGDFEPASTDLEANHNDVFLETIAWLKECRQLRILAFTNIPSATSLMASIFYESSIQLTSLKYEGEGFPDTERFLPALANQTSLRLLSLQASQGEEAWDPGAASVLVESLSKLVNLTDLRVGQKFDDLSNRHIVRLARSLPELEVWSTDGAMLNDGIWGAVASLRSLRRLEFYAQTVFTVDGILDFIDKLGPGNKGLFLDVKRSAREFSLEEQKLIQERITEKVGGDFDYYYEMDPDISFSSAESESESS